MKTTKFHKPPMMYFKDKTVVISGASRGIGKAIALKLAAEGANIVIAAKSVEEHPKLGGTIYSAAEEIEAAGGKALPMRCDIRNDEDIQAMVDAAVEKFGGIDILINNASAISLLTAEKLSPKQYDLMFDINVRGTFMMCKACIPYLKASGNGHILNLSPPITLEDKFLGDHLAYTMSKLNMTMVALGLSVELKQFNVAANTLWPKTTIATSAVKNLLGGEQLMNMSRKVDIVADAAHYILSQPAEFCTGNTFIDEYVLREAGVEDFEDYSVVPNAKLYSDLFL